jgi:seryl-tRNA(Sec) selenium transferase
MEALEPARPRDLPPVNAVPSSATASALAAMLSPVALQFDLSAGKRGERDDHLRVDALVAVRAQLGWSFLEEAAPLVFDAARTPDAAVAGLEGNQTCSA